LIEAPLVTVRQQGGDRSIIAGEQPAQVEMPRADTKTTVSRFFI
jgi:hypothetical protein